MNTSARIKDGYHDVHCPQDLASREQVQGPPWEGNRGNASIVMVEGSNKNRRDVARGILCFVALTLLGGKHLAAVASSGLAVLVLKEGTLFSTKNVKWLTLSAVSFAVSLFAYSMGHGSDTIDEDRAYALKILLRIAARSTQTCWGIILGFFLVSAAAADPSEGEAPEPLADGTGHRSGRLR